MKTQYKYISNIAVAALISCTAFGGASDGSLWTSTSNNEHSMFADKTATRIGDILTIVVSESSSISSSAKTTTSKESNISNDFSRLFFANVLRSHGEAPSTDIKIGANTHDGSGTLDNTHSVSTRISVQVVDLLPNGNMVLEGVRVLSYEGETYYMLVQGVCRPADVATDNSIASTQIADARIEVIAEGSLTDAQKQGWMTRFANHISP